MISWLCIGLRRRVQRGADRPEYLGRHISKPGKLWEDTGRSLGRQKQMPAFVPARTYGGGSVSATCCQYKATCSIFLTSSDTSVGRISSRTKTLSFRWLEFLATNIGCLCAVKAAIPSLLYRMRLDSAMYREILTLCYCFPVTLTGILSATPSDCNGIGLGGY